MEADTEVEAQRLHDIGFHFSQLADEAVRVAEEAIAAATLELAHKGLYVEPTCAQAAAAYHELLASGAISAEQLTVVVLTGTGVKATPRIAEILGVAL